MSWIPSSSHGPGIVRASDAETLVAGPRRLQLLLDSSATGGALSSHRVRLGDGAEGANPHRHTRSSELFYVLDGSVDVLAGEKVVTATEGDMVVVPPGVAHAFGASKGHDGELLVVITPGIERFEFFRQLVRIMTGTAPQESLMGTNALYDTYAMPRDVWDQARSAGGLPTKPT